MARNATQINAPVAAVWATLADPYAYPEWVVGTDRTVDADAGWPLTGSSFRVRLPFGPVDETTVREAVPQERIVLDAASRYFGPARITMLLEPRGTGTHVVIIEDPAGKLAPLRKLPPAQLLLRLRNVEAMRRFRRLVEERSKTPRAS